MSLGCPLLALPEHRGGLSPAMGYVHVYSGADQRQGAVKERPACETRAIPGCVETLLDPSLLLATGSTIPGCLVATLAA